jgi:hypothetical protein
MTPPVGCHHQSCGFLLCAGTCLGLLFCREAGLCLLIVVGLHLLQMGWPLRCRGSSLLGRGSWIARKVPLPHGRMDWQSLSAPLERCAWDVTPVAFEPGLSSRTSLPSCASLAPGPDNSPTSIRHWRNAKSFASRKWTQRCERRYWSRSRNAAYIALTGETCKQN